MIYRVSIRPRRYRLSHVGLFVHKLDGRTFAAIDMGANDEGISVAAELSTLDIRCNVRPEP
ncbi:MAG: hypothetical protein H6715_02540 [Myxococcales bacterium]|nr:hypothetical protein [Myxococcales bacterium]